MRFFFLSFIVLAALDATAQSFDRTHGGEGFDRGMHIFSLNNGWIVCGYSSSFGNGNQVYLIKLDKLGNKQWEKNYGGAGFEMGWTIKNAGNGAFMVLGMTNSRDSLNHDILVMKLERDGEMIWEKTFGNKKYERATDLMPTADGNFLISGQRNASSTNIDNYLLKIDPDGNLIWEKSYGDSLSQRNFYSSGTKNGDYIVAGVHLPAGTSNTDIVLSRIDKDGNFKWTKNFGQLKDHDIVHSLTRNRNGSYALIGYRSADRAGFHDALLLQVDENGKLLMEKTYSNGDDLRLMHAEPTPDGGLIATGFTRKDISKEIWDAVLIKFNSLGEKEWIKTFGSADKDDQGYWVVVNSDGGFTLTGYTHSKGKNGDLWVIRTDAKGNLR